MINPKSDVVVQREVQEELNWEPSVNAANIGVIVKGGVVTLSGAVPNFAQKRTAVQAALRVSGVKAVVEEIEVQLPHAKKRTDVDLAKAVIEALKWHVYLPEETITVKVEEGVVTLEGEVSSQPQLALNIDMAYLLEKRHGQNTHRHTDQTAT